MNSSDQQSHQSLHNVSFQSAPDDKSEEALLDNADLRVRPSTSQGLDESLETGKKLEKLVDRRVTPAIPRMKNIFSFESEDYSSDEGDEIKILSVTQIDDREPCQDHVAERILYCEWCAKCIGKDNLIPEAKCMSFKTEMYVCSNCASMDNHHVTVRIDEHESENDHRINRIVDSLLLEDDDERQRQMAKSRYNICGRIDLRVSRETASSESYRIRAVCISMDGKLLVVTDECNHCIKVFNMYNHKMIQYIQLSCKPHGVAEIPHHLIQEHLADAIDNLEIDSSQTYIAVSFPEENKILIIDFGKNHACIVYTVRIFGASGCREVFLCNGLLVTYCFKKDRFEDPTDHKIKLLTMKGILVRTIDIFNIPDFAYPIRKAFHIAVHAESNTIYICSPHHVSIVGVDMHGNIIETVSSSNIGIFPTRIHVNSDRNVFVSTLSESPIYSTGLYKITDNLKNWQRYIPRYPKMVSNYQWSCVYTSWKGKLFCVKPYMRNFVDEWMNYVTLLQREPSFLRFDESDDLLIL